MIIRLVELTGVGNRSQINADDNIVIYYIIALLHCLFFVCTIWAWSHMPTPITHLCFALLSFGEGATRECKD